MDQTRPIDRERARADVSGVRQLARLLDAAVRIPGTEVRLGFDALLGLIPGAGDIAGGILSAFIILRAARLGAPRSVLTRMVMNVVIDTAAGSVPVLGDVFDVGWKSNLRNVALLERYTQRPEVTRRASRLAVAGAVTALAVAVVGAIALVVVIIRGLATLAT